MTNNYAGGTVQNFATVASSDFMHFVINSTLYSDTANNLYFITFSSANGCTVSEILDNEPVVFKDGVNGAILGYGRVSTDAEYNALGVMTNFDLWVNFDSFDSSLLTNKYFCYKFINASKPALHAYSPNTGQQAATQFPSGVNWQTDYPGEEIIIRGMSGIYYVMKGDYQSVTHYQFDQTITVDYNNPVINKLSLYRNDLFSAINIYNTNNDMVYNNSGHNDLSDIQFISEGGFYYDLYSFDGTYFRQEYYSVEDYNLYLTKSKDTELTLNEELNYNLYGINSLLNINSILWNTYKVDRDDYVIGDYHKGVTYEKINDTHWNKFSVYNDDNFDSPIVESVNLTLATVNTEYNRMTNSYNRSGTYKTIVSAYKEDIGGNHILLGTTNTSVNVGAGSAFLVQNTFNIFDASTSNALSGSLLELYGVNSDGLEFITSRNLTGSFTTEDLKYGMIYKYYVYKAGYATAQNTFTAISGDTHNIYLNPVSTGYTSLNFMITDSDYNRLQYALVDVNGDVKYTNQAGLVSFTGLAINTTYAYNASLAGYISQSGDIYADEPSEQINIYLINTSSVYPTPTPTPQPTIGTPQNPKEAILFSFANLLGITDLEEVKIVLSVIICFVLGVFVASITKSGIGFISGAGLGFIGCLALGWIPIWVFFVTFAGILLYILVIKQKDD